MANKYTPRTLKYLRENLQLKCHIVEQWVPGANVRRDLFNIIDIIGISKERTIGVQSTSYACRKGHIKKLLEDEKENTLDWLSCDCRELLLVTWRKKKLKRGGIAFRYVVVVDEIRMEGEYLIVHPTSE